MKLTLAILFSLMSLTAFADCNREAEFIGKAKNVIVQQDSVSFQIKLGNFYAINTLCPLYEQEAEEAVIVVAGRPDIKEGQEVSGVLVFDQETQTYRID